MKINVRARHLVWTTDQLAEVRRRLEEALARISPSIRTVDVTISPGHGPDGQRDTKCVLRIRGRSIPTIVVAHTGVDMLSTISRAADHAQQAAIHKAARRRLLRPLPAY